MPENTLEPRQGARQRARSTWAASPPAQRWRDLMRSLDAAMSVPGALGISALGCAAVLWLLACPAWQHGVTAQAFLIAAGIYSAAGIVLLGVHLLGRERL
jgi:hypothetical protein